MERLAVTGVILHLLISVCVGSLGAKTGEGQIAKEDVLTNSQKQLRILQQAEGRLAFGTDAPCGRYPYMVSLRDRENRHKCAGVLVDPQWVMTSASCVDPKDNASLKGDPVIVIGACNLDDLENGKNKDGGTVEAFLPKQTFVHENWTGLVEDGFDIALLLINGKSVNSPVRLAAPSKPSFGTDRVVALGWGKDESGKLAKNLQQADSVRIILNRFCDGDAYWPFLKDSMMCAFGLGTGENVCEGDEGSPLLEAFAPNGDFSLGSAPFDILIGITSFVEEGVMCGKGKRPGVYTRVSSFTKWAEEKIRANTKRQFKQRSSASSVAVVAPAVPDAPVEVTSLSEVRPEAANTSEAAEGSEAVQNPGDADAPTSDPQNESNEDNAETKTTRSKKDRCSFCPIASLCFGCDDVTNDDN